MSLHEAYVTWRATQEHKQPEPEQKPFELSDDQVAALDDQVALTGEA